MKISYKNQQGTLIASLSGEIDHHFARGLGGEIDRKFALSGARNIIIDLSGLSFMDSSGLGVIIGRYKNVSALGGKLAVTVKNETVKRLIGLSGLQKIIPVCTSIDAALKGM